jgi:hypothetical protein
MIGFQQYIPGKSFMERQVLALQNVSGTRSVRLHAG